MSSAFWIVTVCMVAAFFTFVSMVAQTGKKKKHNNCCGCTDHTCDKDHKCCDHRHQFFID